MTYQRGEARPDAKLTEADVLAIRQLYADGAELWWLAEQYPQCSKVNLHHIVHGRRWRHLLAKEA